MKKYDVFAIAITVLSAIAMIAIVTAIFMGYAGCAHTSPVETMKRVCTIVGMIPANDAATYESVAIEAARADCARWFAAVASSDASVDSHDGE